MTGDSSRVRTLGAGAADARASAAHRGRADPLARQAVAFVYAHARPERVGAAGMSVRLIHAGGLPEEAGKLARAGHRHRAAGLSPLEAQTAAALVKPARGTPAHL